MANDSNLTPWQPGQSGNPNGKPKGTKHISTWIREMLEDEQFQANIQIGYKIEEYKGAPLKAIIGAQIRKALNGDSKAFDQLARYGYGVRNDEQTNQFVIHMEDKKSKYLL